MRKGTSRSCDTMKEDREVGEKDRENKAEGREGRPAGSHLHTDP